MKIEKEKKRRRLFDKKYYCVREYVGKKRGSDEKRVAQQGQVSKQ